MNSKYNFMNKNNLKHFYKQVNWKLLLIIFLMILMPTIYSTTSIFFIGTVDDGYSYSIASQIQWLNILYEMITEALMVPLFFVFSKMKNNIDLNKKMSNEDSSTITLLSLIVFSMFLMFTMIIFCTLYPLLNSMLNDNELIQKSLTYMHYETWSMFFTSMASFFIVMMSTLSLKGFLTIGIVVNIIYLMINVFLDLFMMSSYHFSLDLGFMGAGISSLTSSICYAMMPIVYLSISKVFLFNFTKQYIVKKDIGIYFKNMLISGIETCVSNVIFSYMMIGMMNKIGNQGIYWQANSFMWTWMLMPVTVMSLFMKETHANTKYFKDENIDFKYKLSFYYSLMTITMLLWLIFIPINPLFMKMILNYSNYDDVNKVVMLLFSFYIFYALSSVIDSIFMADGSIMIFLLQTLIINLTLYPMYFVLYKTGYWIPTLESIAIMFGLGLLFDFFVDLGFLMLISKFNDNKMLMKM